MIECKRCGRSAEPPEPKHVGMPRSVKAEILESTCAPCWDEWEQLQVKVINEHQLSVIDARHRQMLVQTCREFLNLPVAETGTPVELLKKVKQSETPG